VILVPEDPLPEWAILGILAIVQGITEFLPISSDGHLVLVQIALGLKEAGLGTDVALHLGTLVSVLVVYRRDLLELLRGARRGELREPLFIVLATIPVAIVGLLVREEMHTLFQSARAAAFGLCGTAAILVVGELARRRSPAPRESLGLRDALLIGLAQPIALLPGVSRSGTTIAVALMLGLSSRAAARFSFLIAIPAILGAAVLEVPGVVAEGGASPLLGAAVVLAGLVGFVALRALLAFLGRGAFAWFALYCLVLGLAVLACL